MKKTNIIILIVIIFLVFSYFFWGGDTQKNKTVLHNNDALKIGEDKMAEKIQISSPEGNDTILYWNNTIKRYESKPNKSIKG